MTGVSMALLPIGLKHFMILAAFLFSLGTYCVLTRKNAVGILIGVELILNSANINFVAVAHYVTGSVSGHVTALVIIVLAAAEAVVALAIVLAMRHTLATIDTTRADLMKG